MLCSYASVSDGGGPDSITVQFLCDLTAEKVVPLEGFLGELPLPLSVSLNTNATFVTHSSNTDPI